MPDVKRCAVVGVGNVLMGDDGVGVAAVEAMRSAGADDVLCLDAGTALFAVLPQVADCERVIIVDSVRAGSPPGSVYRIRLNVLDGATWAPSAGVSAHDLAVLPSLQQHALAFGWRPETILVGVEPQVTDFCSGMSDAVRDALPKVVEIVRGEVARTRLLKPVPEETR